MKAQRNKQGVTIAPEARKLKLLLVGRDCELKDDLASRIFSEDRLWITERSASLPGALERLQSEAIDLVLLSHEFRDEELALFTSGARRDGYAGFILRVTSTQAFRSDSSGDSPCAGSAKGLLENPLYPMRIALGMRRQNKRSNAGISFTARQRAVLTHVSEGWANQQIARYLKCTEGAVKATLQEIFRKLGVRKRSQIVRLAFEKGLIDTESKIEGRLYRTMELAHLPVPPTNFQGKEPIHVGDFVMDLAMHRVWVRGAETHLTPSEFELLAVFLTRSGELVRSTSLCEMFWGNQAAKQESLHVLIAGLRAKIEVSTTPRYIVTERNFGYRFVPSPARPPLRG